MNRGKIFRRGFIAFLSVIFLLSAVGGATVKLYTASGEGYCYVKLSKRLPAIT